MIDYAIWALEACRILTTPPDPCSLHSEEFGPVYVGYWVVPNKHDLLWRCEPCRY